MEDVGKDHHLDSIEDFSEGWLCATSPNIDLSFEFLLEDKLTLCGPNSKARMDVSKSSIEKVGENIVILKICNENSKQGQLAFIKYRGYLCNST